jgi:hypothetical protein
MKLLEEALLNLIIAKYGLEEQLLQTSGECGELIAVIQNYLRAEKFGWREETLADVLNEAVDVFFMIQQIRHINPAAFDELCGVKVVSLRQKIMNEGFKNAKGRRSKDLVDTPNSNETV